MNIIKKIIFILFFLYTTYLIYDFTYNVPTLNVGNLHKVLINKNERIILYFIGDSGTGNSKQKAVAKSMEEFCLKNSPPDGIVMLGDNFYMDGVKSTKDSQWNSKIFDVYNSPCLKDIPIYAVLGNHDYRTNPTAQIEMTKLNKRWYMPNRYYSVDFGTKLRLIAFDSSRPNACFNSKQCTVDYTYKMARKSTTDWTIIFSHHPLSSSSIKGFSHNGGLRGFLLKPLFCNAADVFISGHAHHMEHINFEGCKIEQFVSGSAGAKLNLLTQPTVNNSLFAKSQYGFLNTVVTTDKINFSFIGLKNEILYQFSKHH